MRTLNIRPALPADAAVLGRLHVASWRETYAGILPDAMLADLSVAARTAMWSAVLAGPADHGCIAVFVVEDGDRAVGFGACGRQRDRALADAGYGGEFSAIYILRSHQGRGAGRSVMRAMARALIGAGHAAASLWVLRDNHPARAFYAALGGQVLAERIEPSSAAGLIELAYGWPDLAPWAG